MQVTVQLIHGTITWASPLARRRLEAIIAARGLIRGADSLARALGFRDRHQLKRQLEREGLPGLEVLCGWIRVLLWVEEWERAGVALSRGALRSDTDPAVRFRCVKRITGCAWSEVRMLGSTWVILKLMEQCRKPPQGGGGGSPKTLCQLPADLARAEHAEFRHPIHPLAVVSPPLPDGDFR